MSQMVQGTAEWLEWRKKGIGASDAPIILEKSPYSTPHKLWLQKLGLEDGNKPNFATNLGHKFEEPALAMFCLETGLDVEPDLVEHSQIPEFRASLDGVNFEKKLFLELKYMGDENLKKVEETQKPLDHHLDQLAHQHMVTGFEEGYYGAYGLDSSRSRITKLVIVKVKPDWNYIEKILAPKELEFLNLIKTQTPPPLSRKDILRESDINNIAMARRWRELKKQSGEIDSELEKIEAHLKKLTNTHPRVSCGTVVINKGIRKGSVDYAKIPELEKVNLEAFRKAPVTTISIREMKGIEDADNR